MAFSMQGQTKRTSFSDALEVNSDMRENIVEYLFSHYKISSYEEFQDALFNYFDTPHGSNAMISSDDAIVLFNKSECKSKMKENTTQQEYDEAYGDGTKVSRVAVNETKVVTISVPKVSVHTYMRNGSPVKPYNRGKANKWTNPQVLFLRERTGRSSREVLKEYNAHFSANPRTESSVTTKFGRISKSSKSGSKTYSQS